MKEKKIHIIIEYIANSSTDELSELTVKKIADEFNISYSHLSRSFFKARKIHIGAFLLNIKLTSSIPLLLGYPDLTIREIAKKVGFASSIYFSKAFKKRMGATPSEFRKFQE